MAVGKEGSGRSWLEPTALRVHLQCPLQSEVGGATVSDRLQVSCPGTGATPGLYLDCTLSSADSLDCSNAPILCYT